MTAPITPDHPPILEISLEALKGRLEGKQMLVRPYPLVTESKGGIILEGAAALRPPLAWVVDMSEGAMAELKHTQVGDTVILAGDQALPLFELGDGPARVTYSLVSASTHDTPASMNGAVPCPKTS